MPVDWYVIYIFITPLWVSSHTLLTLVIFPLTTLTTVNAEKIPTMKCATLDFQVFLRLLGAARSLVPQRQRPNNARVVSPSRRRNELHQTAFGCHEIVTNVPSQLFLEVRAIFAMSVLRCSTPPPARSSAGRPP